MVGSAAVESVEEAGDPAVTLRFRLTYADTDPAGLVYYGAWFPWMERAQSELFHRAGLPQDRIAERHGFWTVVAHTECDYLAATRLYDEIELGVTLEAVGRTSITTGHRLVRIDDGVLVARAQIVLATVDADGHPIRVPDLLPQRLRAVSASRRTTG